MAITLDGTNGVTTPDLTVDTDTLKVDSANNRVGINTTTGPESLNIGSNGNLRFQTSNTVRIEYLNTTGAYGLGTTGGAAIGFNRPATGDDEIFFETHNGGVSHAERMRINKDGYVTKPNQISFFAGWTTTSNAGGYGSVQYGAGFGTVGWNIGSGWDSAGTFTAPVAGKYLIYLAMSFTSGANRCHVGFYINGGGGTTSQGNSSGDPWLQTGLGNEGSGDQDHVLVSKVFNLNANDTLKPVYLIFDNDNNSQIFQHRTYVGGYLLG